MRSSTAASARSSAASSSRRAIGASASRSREATAKSARKNVDAIAAADNEKTPTTTTTTTWRNSSNTASTPSSRRSALLAAGGIALSGALLGLTRTAGAAAEVAGAAATSSTTTTTSTSSATTAATTAAASAPPPYPTVYFGNGCFWGRQHDFVEVETKQLGRSPQQLTSVTGYAGGARGAAPDGRVCYYYANDSSVYERRGHAEVVRVGLAPPGSSSSSIAEQEAAMRAFSKTYFEQFVPRTSRDGKKVFALRQDPQDAGPGYRNVVGLPGGGIRSPLFKILDEERAKSPLADAIELVEGRGNDFVSGRPTEDDKIGVVYVYDADKLPFYAAERYHQMHDGLGKFFDKTYKRTYKRAAEEAGTIRPTGCPEFPFL